MWVAKFTTYRYRKVYVLSLTIVCFRISNLLRSRTRDKKYTFSKWVVPLNLVTVLDGKIHVSVNPVLGKVYLLKVYLLSPSESNFRPAYDPKQHYGSARPYEICVRDSKMRFAPESGPGIT